MYIVNTSFMVEPSVHDRWLKFVTEKYIPALRARGFGKVVFTRVLSVDAEDHFTYSLQVNADDMEAYHSRRAVRRVRGDGRGAVRTTGAVVQFTDETGRVLKRWKQER